MSYLQLLSPAACLRPITAEWFKCKPFILLNQMKIWLDSSFNLLKKIPLFISLSFFKDMMVSTDGDLHFSSAGFKFWLCSLLHYKIHAQYAQYAQYACA